MTNIDQNTYEDLIQDAEHLRSQMAEWVEQMSNADADFIACFEALNKLREVPVLLREARDRNQHEFQQRVNAALFNVEAGMATRADAALLRSALS